MKTVIEVSAWSAPDFRTLWRASAVSATGTEIGEIALPVLALVVLQASAVELSVVRAAQLLPFLILPLALGVLVERRPQRRLMVQADLVRGIVLLLVAALALTGALTVPALAVFVAVIGAGTVLYSLADFSYLPRLLTPEQLPDGNARLTATQSALSVGGQGVGGALVQAVTAPWAVVVNGAAYLASGLFLRTISTPDHRSQPAAGSSVGLAWGGVRTLWRHKQVRALAAEATIWNLGNEVLMLSISILVIRTYSLGPLVLGLILMAGGVGAFIGSMFSARLTRTVGYGRGLIAALVLGNSAPLAVITFTTGTSYQVILLGAAFLMSGLGIGVANSQAVTVRQLSVPEHLRSRVNAAYRLLSWGALAFGALGAGLLNTTVGAHPAAVVGAAVMASATIPVALSPVRAMQTTIPEHG